MKHLSSPDVEIQNQILLRLPLAEQQRLSPSLEMVELTDTELIYAAGGPIEYAYFPTGAVLSALHIMSDGNAIEVATIGREGMTGHHGTIGKVSPHRVVAQIPGPAVRIASRSLEQEEMRSKPLRDVLIAYHGAFLAQMSQSVACNGLHRLEQRCCRWLLMSRDRVGSDQLKLTHEFLASMLGVRRASVTDALGPLQEAGLIRSVRGRITILDGCGLEDRACECYFTVREEYERLLGSPR